MKVLSKVLSFYWPYCFKQGYEVDPKKTNAIKNWPRPISHLDITSFLGTLGDKVG